MRYAIKLAHSKNTQHTAHSTQHTNPSNMDRSTYSKKRAEEAKDMRRQTFVTHIKNKRFGVHAKSRGLQEHVEEQEIEENQALDAFELEINPNVVLSKAYERLAQGMYVMRSIYMNMRNSYIALATAALTQNRKGKKCADIPALTEQLTVHIREYDEFIDVVDRRRALFADPPAQQPAQQPPAQPRAAIPPAQQDPMQNHPVILRAVDAARMYAIQQANRQAVIRAVVRAQNADRENRNVGQRVNQNVGQRVNPPAYINIARLHAPALQRLPAVQNPPAANRPQLAHIRAAIPNLYQPLAFPPVRNQQQNRNAPIL